MATKNKNIYKIGKVYSSNPFSKIIEKTKGKIEIEKEKLTQEQKDLVNSLTIELDKILYKNFEEEEENDYEKGEEKNNIEEVKNVENKNTIILKESLPKGLKLNDLENIKMIAKFMNKLTLSEQRRVNFPKQ
uniref:Uncharacterized protein n=1 Tax=Meloidogyne enterolobii TaxID=390850 RepID=A0A6V7VIG3_MELEN|nr:unnamed protein product [Meloidogyne enterolobii]